MSKTILTFDEIMNFDKRNAEVYGNIVKQYKGKGLIPFVGAGMSVSAGLPTWDGFLENEYCEYVDGRKRPPDPLDAASELLNILKNADFYEDIVNAFGGSFTNADWDIIINRIRDKAVSLLPKLFHEVIITTNFDMLLEKIYPFAVISHPGHDGQLNRAVQLGTNTVLKLHGCVSDPENIILTRESYEKAYPEIKVTTHVVGALERILTRNTVIFLGCSLKDDYTVKRWARMIAQPEGKGIRHYAIVGCISDDKQKRRAELSNMNIRSILYDETNHDAVRVILQQLYIDTGGCKPPNNLLPKYEYFTGRENELETLKNNFYSNRQTIQVISGLGGIGKTQTALEYAHRHLDEYLDGVWWLNSENEIELIRDCRDILVQSCTLDKTQALALKPDELIDRWHDWLSKHKDCLLIFDNIDSNVQLHSYIPKEYRGHVLMTTRNEIWSGKPTLTIQQMPKTEAIEFLLRRTKRVERLDMQDRVSEVSERLGYLPIALEQAAAFIFNSDLSFSGYLDLLSDYGLETLEKDYAKPDEMYYKKIVTTTWQVSFDLIEKNNKVANKLFSVFAYADSNDIPIDVFIDHKQILPKALQEVLASKLSIIDVIVLLRQYSLIERNGKDDYLISIHRLVQEVVRDKLAKKADYSFLDYCFNVLYEAIPRKYGSERVSRDLFERVATHALTSSHYQMEIYQKDSANKEQAASMFHWIGWGYYEIAQFRCALDMYNQSLAIRDNILSKKDTDIAATYNNIAIVFSSQSNYLKALEWHNKALVIREKVLGKEHPDTAESYNNIADVFSRQGDYPEAMEWYQKALAIYEKVLGKEHPDTATIYHSIAGVYASQEDYSKAMKWCQKALIIRENKLGKEHPDTAETYNSISEIYYYQEDYPKAMELCQKALVICISILGKEHPDTATMYNNIASVYIGQEDYSKAMEFTLKALVIHEKVLGKEHPKTAFIYNNIAGIHECKGNYLEALGWYQKALTICEKILGKKHPDTAIIYDNIARIHKLKV